MFVAIIASPFAGHATLGSLKMRGQSILQPLNSYPMDWSFLNKN